MSHPRFSARILVVGLVLTALLVVVLTLGADAQDPEVRDLPVPPEQVTVVEEVELLPDPSALDATLYYKFISANTFVPYDDDMTYTYSSGGCMYRNGGGNYTEHTLQLPQGAEIDYLRVYFWDNDATHNATAYLFAYDGKGGTSTIASVSSSGQADSYRSEGSGYFSHIVDNLGEALSLSLYYGGATTSDLKICGVRIRYQYTLSVTDLPMILNGAGP
jgi:hypothetical protein